MAIPALSVKSLLLDSQNLAVNSGILTYNSLSVSVATISVANTVARHALTLVNVKLGDIVVQGASAPYAYYQVIDMSNLNNENGYVQLNGAGSGYNTAITGLTGGTASTLDGIATVGVTPPIITGISVAGLSYVYQLVAGTTSASSPTIIHPADYNASTNAKFWQLLGAEVNNMTVVGTLTATLTPTQVGLSNVTNDAQLTAAQLDTDQTLAANSDAHIPSQKAVKAYVDSQTGVGASLPFTVTASEKIAQNSDTNPLLGVDGIGNPFMSNKFPLGGSQGGAFQFDGTDSPCIINKNNTAIFQTTTNRNAQISNSSASAWLGFEQYGNYASTTNDPVLKSNNNGLITFDTSGFPILVANAFGSGLAGTIGFNGDPYMSSSTGAMIGFGGSTPGLLITNGGSPCTVTANWPTSDPHVSGALWNNSGTLTISAG